MNHQTINRGVTLAFSDLKNRTETGIFYLDSLTVYDYYPYGMLKPGRYYEDAWSRYGFNGMEKDDDVKGEGNSYDFGARVYDPRTVRFYSLDRYTSKFPYFSPYLFAGNSPIMASDKNGDSLYILIYVTQNKDSDGDPDPDADDMFKSAAITRQLDIERSKTFDSKRDKVVLIEVADLAKIKVNVKKVVSDFSKVYGKTAEVGLYSHAALDGPRGGVKTSEDPLKPGSKQMNLEGWAKINLNFSSQDARIGFFGCNTGNAGNRSFSFATMVSFLKNYNNVSVFGQTTKTYPSQYTNTWNPSLDQINGNHLPVFVEYQVYKPRLGGWVNMRMQVRHTYLVGSNASSLDAFLGGAKAESLSVSKNGVELKNQNIYQEGAKEK